MKKVLHLITGLEIGGTERMLLKVLPMLKNYENCVCCIKGRGPIGKELENKGIRVHYLDYNNLNLFHIIREFHRVVREEKPDILHTYLIHAGLFGRVIGRLFGIKKIVCSLRGSLLQWEFLSTFDRLSSSLVTKYVAVSDTTRNQWIKRGLKPEKIETIYNGIEIGKYAQKKVKVRGKEFVLGVVGKLREGKGHEYLLRAMPDVVSKHPETMLWIVGDGELCSELEKQVDSLGMKKHVKFLGYKKDIPGTLSKLDVFVLPTLYEGMSNALLEAMAAKCPIVTTDIPENQELVGDGREALLVPPEDASALSRALLKMQENRALRNNLAENAYKKVLMRFTLRDNVKKIEGLYETICAE